MKLFKIRRTAEDIMCLLKILSSYCKNSESEEAYIMEPLIRQTLKLSDKLVYTYISQEFNNNGGI